MGARFLLKVQGNPVKEVKNRVVGMDSSNGVLSANSSYSVMEPRPSNFLPYGHHLEYMGSFKSLGVCVHVLCRNLVGEKCVLHRNLVGQSLDHGTDATGSGGIG